MKNLLNMFIDKMIIRNFKGVKELVIDFKDVTNIYAANGGFKTTIADAWFWALYGKDSQDRKDFNIKNTVDTSLNRGEHEVLLFITTGSNQDVFKRVFREKWTKPKGQKNQIYTGNETLYYCNDVPMQAKEYQAKIDSIIGEGALKLLTNPSYFNSLKWTERRNILFDLAGNVTDAEVAGTRPEFAALMNSLSNKSLVEYKREVSAKKKKLKDDLVAIPARIDELQRSLPEVADYARIEAEIALKQSQISEIETAMNDRTSAYDQEYKKIQLKQSEIHNLKTKLNQIKFRIQSEIQSASNQKIQKQNQLANRVQTLEQDIKSKKNLIQSSEKKVSDLAAKTDELRNRWAEKNITEIKFQEGAFCCPTCKRDLDEGDVEEKKNQLISNFNNDKNRVLDSIVAEANSHKKEVESTNQMVVTLKNALQTLENQLGAAKQELSAFYGENDTENESLESILLYDDQYVQLSQELKLREAEPIISPKIDLSDLKEEKRLIALEIDQLKAKLSTKVQREKALKRLGELENEEGNLAQQIADLEGIEFTIEDFNRAKIATTESRINGLFRYVTFKMFDYTVDGNPVETCETMYNGVPFSDLNTAGKVWAGLDIISTLSTHYGISAPVFIDNRESITLIPDVSSQIINLIVSPEDKVLRVA